MKWRKRKSLEGFNRRSEWQKKDSENLKMIERDYPVWGRKRKRMRKNEEHLGDLEHLKAWQLTHGGVPEEEGEVKEAKRILEEKNGLKTFRIIKTLIIYEFQSTPNSTNSNRFFTSTHHGQNVKRQGRKENPENRKWKNSFCTREPQ